MLPLSGTELGRYVDFMAAVTSMDHDNNLPYYASRSVHFIPLYNIPLDRRWMFVRTAEQANDLRRRSLKLSIEKYKYEIRKIHTLAYTVTIEVLAVATNTVRDNFVQV